MKNIKEESTFKPTLEQPSGELSKVYEKNFKKTMNQDHVSLNEVDGLLNEAELSLKKKIFSLAKMEALVFADPKLAVVYDEMAENGEERFGYHYNETIMNMLFNDYVLNSPRYLEKYKMAQPLKKKRRDKSGINQLKKAGDVSMHKKPVNPIKTTPAVAGIGEEVTNETTGAGGAGAFVPALGFKNPVDETTTSASSGSYVGPAAWGSGDLLKTGGKSKAMRKPIWQGGTIIQESNYLTDPSAFAKYVDMLNEEVEINSSAQQTNVQPNKNQAASDKIIDKTAAFNSNTVKNWNKSDTELELQTLKNGRMDENNNDSLVDFDIPEWAISALINGDYSGLEGSEDEAKLNKFIQKVVAQFGNANFMLGDIEGNDNLGFRPSNDIDNLGSNTYRLYLRPSKSSNPVGDETTAYDRMYNSDAWVQAQRDAEGLDEKATSPSQQRLFGMAHAAQKGEIPMSKLGGTAKKIANTVSPKDVTDFASTKYDEMNEETINELSVHDAVEYVSDRNGENPFELGGIKWQFVNAKYPNGKVDIGVYRFGHDIVYDYGVWRDTFNLNETIQSIIDDKPDSVAKGTPTGTVTTGNVPVGLVDMKEEVDLLNEINNELNAYSIHHNKLKQMSEDRKPSSLVMKDRLGSENQTNFKKDLQHSGTKEIIDVEKELQYKDQQTEANPEKLGAAIEKNEMKVTKGEALKNVGNSANDKGDEIPKRNMTTAEQDEVNLYRKGMHSLTYDNKPDQRFEDRMKADMGDAVYEIREKQMADFGKQPMYNKEAQPTEPTKAVRTEFDKEKSGWNDPKGLSEAMISGRYRNALDKSHIIDFALNEVKVLKQTSEATMETLFPLDFTGLGNTLNGKTHNYKVSVNEGVVSILEENKFYTDGTSVYAIKHPKMNLTEADNKVKPVVNEEMNKMKHLLGYKGTDFVSTNNVKKNRGF